MNVRYQPPEGGSSQLVTQAVFDSGDTLADATDDLRFSAAVAGFGLLLRRSSHAHDLSWEEVLALASTSIGEDRWGDRAELLGLVQTARGLATTATGQ